LDTTEDSGSECRGCLVEDGKGDSVVVKYQYSVGQDHLNGWEFGYIRRCNDKCKNSILHLQATEVAFILVLGNTTRIEAVLQLDYSTSTP
jgi:hypothetical protein